MKFLRSPYFKIVLVFYFLSFIVAYFFYDNITIAFLFGAVIMFLLLYKFKLLNKKPRLDKLEKTKEKEFYL